MDGDGFPEIAFGARSSRRRTTPSPSRGPAPRYRRRRARSRRSRTFVDLDGAPDNHLELLAGNTAYKADGTVLWDRARRRGPARRRLPGVGDFNGDGKPDVVLVATASVWILDGATGATSSAR